MQSNRPILSGIYTFISAYAQYQLWRLIFTKMIESIIQMVNAHHCHGDYAAFMDVIGNYACVVSGAVYFQLAQTAQGVVDAMTTQPQSPQTLLKFLRAINSAYVEKNADRFVTILDFSQQDWSSWNEAETNAIFAELNKPAFAQIKTFNLSSPFPQQAKATTDLIHVTAQFIDQHPTLTIFDYHNRLLGQLLQEFLPSFNRSNIKKLDLNHTGLRDLEGIALSQLFPYWSVEWLRIANNFLGAEVATTFAKQIQNSSLQFLDLSLNTGLSSQNVVTLTQAAEFSPVIHLDFSGIDLSALNITAFGEAIHGSQLQALTLSSCQLSDFQMNELMLYIQGSLLKKLDVSFNPGITDYSGVDILKASVNGSLVDINLSYTTISDQTLSAFNILGAHSQLQSLHLAYTPISSIGLSIFFQYMPKGLQLLNVHGNLIAASIPTLVNITAHRNVTLSSLDLGETALSDEVAKALFTMIPATRIEWLTLDNNNLKRAGEFLPLMIQQSTQLRYLNIGRTQLSADVFQAVLLASADSSLNTLLAPNAGQLTDNGLRQLARQLIAPVSTSEELGDHLSVDMQREISRANSASALTELDMANDEESIGISNIGIRALCQVLYRTGLSVLSVNIQSVSKSIDYQCFLLGSTQNSVMSTAKAYQSVNPTEFTSSGSTGLIGIALIALVFYVLYQRVNQSRERAGPVNAALRWFGAANSAKTPSTRSGVDEDEKTIQPVV